MKLRRLVGVVLICVSVSTMSYVLYTRYSSMSRMNNLLQEQSTSSTDGNSIESVTDKFISKDMEVDNSLTGVARIEIPSISVNAPIVDGVGENLDYSVGHFPDTPAIGENGNICLAGHSSAIYNCIFNGLADTDLGTEIKLYDASGKMYDYTLISKNVVIPQEMSVLKNKGDNRLTIITCVNSGTMRLVATAKIVSDSEKEGISKEINSGKYRLVGEQLSNFTKSVKDLDLYFSMQSSTRPIKHYFPMQSYNSEDSYKPFKDEFDKIRLRKDEFSYEV